MNRNILKVRFLGMFCRKISKNQIFKTECGEKKYGCLFGMCVVAHLSWPTSKIRGGDKIRGSIFVCVVAHPIFLVVAHLTGESETTIKWKDCQMDPIRVLLLQSPFGE